MLFFLEAIFLGIIIYLKKNNRLCIKSFMNIIINFIYGMYDLF